MPKGAPQRRSQAQRSETTRAALLEATIVCLEKDGYENTTTARVAERAGVSRGAHLHHFQTRATLVAAAAEELTERRNDELLSAARDLPDGREGMLAALDLIWASYVSPLFQAALDLWTSARTDPELRPHLVKVEHDFDRSTAELIRRLFPEQSADAAFQRAIELALATMRGLALLDTLHPGESRGAQQWKTCREQLATMLEAVPAAA